MRIKLFNKKTLYEFYDFNIERHLNFDINSARIRLISKEKTLGPRCIERWVILHYIKLKKGLKDSVEKLVLEDVERTFIKHLNENVGLECLIKKGEIPIEVYRGIKA